MNNTCTQIESLIVREADGTIDARGHAEVSRHLSACAPCRDALAAQRAVRAVLRSRAAEEAPSGFDRRVVTRLQGETDWVPVADWRRWTLALSPLPALLLALLMSGAAGESPAASASVSWQSWDEATGPDAPVASIVWQPGMSEESIFVAALTAHPSDTLETFLEKHADER